MGTQNKAKRLDIYLEEIRSGRMDGEVQDTDLSPLLDLVQALDAVQHPQLSDASLTAGWVRVRAALSKTRPGRLGRPRRFARVASTVLAVFLILLLLTTGTVLAAQDSLPGETLYSVKRAAESVRLVLTHQPASRSLLLMSFAAQRTDELASVCSEQGCPQFLLDDLHEQTQAAADEIERLPLEKRTVLWEQQLALTERQQVVLQQILDAVPGSAWPGLERALEYSRRGHERARQALEQRSSPQAPGSKQPSPPAGQPPQEPHGPSHQPTKSEQSPERGKSAQTPGVPRNNH